MSNIVLPVAKIFRPLFELKRRYKALHGGRGGGKSHTVARYLLLKGMEGTKRILCTREVQSSIAESVHKLLSDLISEYQLPYRVLRTGIFSTINETEFIFHGLRDTDTSKSIKSMESIDIAWVEEAQFVSKTSLDILIPTIRKEGSEIIFSYNRLEESDPVHEKISVNPSKNTLVIEVNYYDNPYLSKVLKEEAEDCKQRNMNDYLHIWEGNPLVDGDNVALPAYKIRQAMERKIENPEGQIEVGVDISQGGGDRIAMYKRKGFKIIDQWDTDKRMRIEDLTNKIVDFSGPKYDLIRIDATSLGWGPTEALEDHKRVGKSKVQGIVFGSKEGVNKDKYPDMITQMYFEFYEMLEYVSMPYDPELLKELSTRRYHFKNAQKIRQIESKDDFKKRYGKSPDKADAFLMAFIGKPKKRLMYALA